ncbi:MAG: hemolysin III family protein [Chloroherpetonaceae bacterium]|nr:hemolysin III family protein [Chloroherpetonaceae bacterium]
MNISLPHYSPSEERFNLITHIIGIFFGAGALVTLLTFALTNGTAWHVVSFAVYGSSLILLYLASTLYHGAKNEGVKSRLRILDHTSIYLLIAGTYTPFTLINLREDWGIPLLVVVWLLASLGIALKFFMIGAKKWVSAVLYIGLGWLILVAINPILAHVPLAGIWWLIAGGLFYTGGVVFYVWKSLPYHHGVWHLFVLVGSVCHFVAVMISSVPF